MEGKKLFRSIRLQNLLSYGNEAVNLELEPLNVLIGPNASGKSNLIDAISVLAAAPRNLLGPFLGSSPAEDWIWKGSGRKADEIPAANIHVRLEGPPIGLEYELTFGVINSRLQVLWETLDGSNGESYVRRKHHSVRIADDELSMDNLDRQQSLLSQVRAPSIYPQLAFVGDQLVRIVVFRGWPFGRDSVLTKPQRTDLPDDFLLPDGSNLALILNDIQNRKTTWRLLLERLRLLYDGIDDVTTKVQGNTIQVFFHEERFGQRTIPAARLSDGTLHYLCLLTVLLHPEPPPLICIEEPELGLHPDVIPKVADLLLDASQRTQLIVTTHSETLISRLSEVPECVVACERDAGGTRLRRLEPENLRAWLDKYMLGEIWRMGEIGANRW